MLLGRPQGWPRGVCGLHPLRQLSHANQLAQAPVQPLAGLAHEGAPHRVRDGDVERLQTSVQPGVNSDAQASATQADAFTLLSTKVVVLRSYHSLPYNFI